MAKIGVRGRWVFYVCRVVLSWNRKNIAEQTVGQNNVQAVSPIGFIALAAVGSAPAAQARDKRVEESS